MFVSAFETLNVRILLILDDGIDRSDREVTLKNWRSAIEALSKREVNVDVVSLRGRILEDVVARMGGRHHSLATRFSLPIHKIPRLATIVSSEPYDIIHGNEVVPTVMAGVAARLRGRPCVVFHRHHKVSGGVHSLLSRFAASLSDVTFAVSQSVAQAAHFDDHSPLHRLHVAPNGVAPLRPVTDAEVSELRADLSIPNTAAVVVTVARLRAEKGHRVLLGAMHHVSRMLPARPHLVVVGDGPEMPQLRAMSRMVDDYVVHLVGHDVDVARWYHLGDVVAVPSLRESFGLAAVEAMACGRPLVASDVGGLSETIIHEKTGLLTPVADASLLAGAIVRLLSEPNFASELGRAGLERFEEMYSIDQMVDAWISGYGDLVATR